MRTPSRLRNRQRGNSMVLALIVLAALATLGSLTVVSVQSSLKASTNDRSQAVALYAAESGCAVAFDFLRANFDDNHGWSSYVRQNNAPPHVFTSGEIPSNDAAPGAGTNPFTADQNAWYHLELLNNLDDPSFGSGGHPDSDGRVTIRATGHGPQGAVAIVEWDILRSPDWPNVRVPTPVPAPVFPIPASVPLILLGWRITLL